MLKRKSSVLVCLGAIAVVSVFFLAKGMTTRLLTASQPPPMIGGRQDAGPSPDGEAALVIGYARVHPDPAINGPFADKLRSGEIKILIEEPGEHAVASFGRRESGYVLSIVPGHLKPEPTREEYEDALSTLSHEHAHYRQFVEGEMINYHPRGGPMTETQCTLTILVEIDAHGKTCRDAKAYGWTSWKAIGACDRTPASIAAYFLRERVRTYPECKPVWEFYSDPTLVKRAPKVEALTVPIYMPPP